MVDFVNSAIYISATKGTGPFTVASPARGYQTPASAGATDGLSYRYRAQNSALTEWEEGTAVASNGAMQFTRVVLVSSAGLGATVDFTSPPTVALTVFAEDILAETAAAAAAAAAALASENNAATSASNAATSETNAAASAAASSSSAAAASTSETNAAASATAAAGSASTASTQASNAAASAAAASTSETNAASSATASAGSATAAASSATSAASSLVSFTGVYYGAFASDPTLDPNGNAPNSGDLYWSTVSSALKIYDGAAWQSYAPALPINNPVFTGSMSGPVYNTLGAGAAYYMDDRTTGFTDGWWLYGDGGQARLYSNLTNTDLFALDSTGLDLPQTTASTTPTTGALKVAGGAGIGGALFVGAADTGLTNQVGFGRLAALGSASADYFLVVPSYSLDANTAGSNLAIGSYPSGTGGSNVYLAIDCYNDDGYGDGLYIQYARGTSVAPLAVNSGDSGGGLTWEMHNGTGFHAVAALFAATDGPQTSTSAPGAVYVSTVPSGSQTPLYRLRIDSNGQVSVLTNIASTSTTTGSLVNPGGIGIGGDAYVGGDIHLDNSSSGAAGASLQFYQNSSTPLLGDKVSLLQSYGNDSAGNKTLYSELSTQVLQATDGSEYGCIRGQVMVNGTLSDTLLGVETFLLGYQNPASNNFEYVWRSPPGKIAYMYLESFDDGATGPSYNIWHNSATPAVNDIPGAFVVDGKDSAGNYQNYSRIETVITDPTSGSEDADMVWYLAEAGTFAERMRLGGGQLNVNGAVLDNAAWTNTNVTLTSASGTLTTVTTAVVRWKQLGKTVWWELYYNIANNGTGSNALRVSVMPFTPVNDAAGSGYIPPLGLGINGYIGAGTTVLTFFLSDGSYPGGAVFGTIAGVTQVA